MTLIRLSFDSSEETRAHHAGDSNLQTPRSQLSSSGPEHRADHFSAMAARRRFNLSSKAKRKPLSRTDWATGPSSNDRFIKKKKIIGRKPNFPALKVQVHDMSTRVHYQRYQQPFSVNDSNNHRPQHIPLYHWAIYNRHTPTHRLAVTLCHANS